MSALPYRKSYEIIGYALEADCICRCARDMLGVDPATPGLTDSEGNPVAPVFLDQCEEDTYCGNCGEPLIES
jgi:hypothetical protein